MKETKKTKVTLLSWTKNPLETVYAEWVQSRSNDPVPDPEQLAGDIKAINEGAAYPTGYENLESEVLDVFKKVVEMKMPLGEHLDFIFLLEHVPVALREQMVRHRIGHKFGDRLGADIIPDLAGNSSFWSQTTRIVDMGTFFTDGEFFEPIWLEENGDRPMPGFFQSQGDPANSRMAGTLREFYQEQMGWIQSAYNRLVKAGMPLEDARNILPVAMQHRMTWKVNFSSLMHVLSRRGCWLAQLGMWRPVIEGIIEELATKVHPTLRRLIDPPCFDSNGNYTKCAFDKENREIITQGDYPPCSLWINKDMRKEQADAAQGWNIEPFDETIVGEARMPRYRKMQERYAELWHRDPVTGERKQLS